MSLVFSLLQNKSAQSVLRSVRAELNVARAELREAQQDLVEARTEETKRRQLEAQESKGGDKRLSKKHLHFAVSTSSPIVYGVLDFRAVSSDCQ